MSSAEQPVRLEPSALVEQPVRLESSSLAEQTTEALLRLTARANCARELEALYEPCLDALLELLRVERAAILLSDADGVVRFKAWRGISAGYRRAVEGHSPWSCDTPDSQPLRIADVRMEPALAPLLPLLAREGIAGLLSVPLICRGQLLGQLTAYAGSPRAFSERELSLAQVVASQIAEACGRARLIEAERAARALAERSADRTRRLLRMTSHLSKALFATEIAEVVIEEGTLALEAESCAIWLLERDALHLLGQRGYSEDVVAGVSTIALDEHAPVACTAQRGEAVWLQSAEEYKREFPTFASWSEAVVSRTHEIAVASLPLSIHGRVVGVLALAFGERRLFDEAERSFLSLVAQHCAQAIERARLYAEGQAAQRRAALLAQVSAVLASSLECETTLRNLVRLTVPELCDWCSIELLDDDGQVSQLAVNHVDPQKLSLVHAMRTKYRPEPSQARGVMQVIRSGQPELHQVITDQMLALFAKDAEQLRLSRAIGIGSVMIVAMRAHGRTFGAITFVSSSSARIFTRADLEIAQQIGERAGVALHNAILYDQAIGAVRARDDFLSIAGHELRTPLTALTLQAQAILSAPQLPDPERARDRAERIFRSTSRLTKLVDELLDVTRITAGQLELTREPVELGALLDEVLRSAGEQLERAGSTVRFLERAPVSGFWDRHRLEQVVMNLLTNALKYGGGAPIELRIGEREGRALLCVRDHGIGISPEHQTRIFGRFERAVSSRNYGGLGLGLWISRQIVEAHGGSISVESEPGSGAEFTVTLPLEQMPEAPDALP